jgi:cell division septation protein DedD
MQPILSNSQRTSCVLAILLLTVLAGMIVPVGGSTRASIQQPDQSDIHTLVIRSAGQPANYSISINGTLTADTSEQSDSIKGNRMIGTVGGRSETTNNTDITDVIKYTGYVTKFQSNTSKIRITLDNALIKPTVLNGKYIQISYENDLNNMTDTLPIKYSFTVTGTVTEEENVETEDEPSNATTVTGRLTSKGDRDGFYYSGKIVSSSFSRDIRVTINGQRVSFENQSQSPTQSLPSTDRPQTVQRTKTNSTTTVPTTEPRTESPQSPPSETVVNERSPSKPTRVPESTTSNDSSSGSPIRIDFMLGFVVGGVLIIAGVYIKYIKL